MLEMCLCNAVAALGMIMAGTGDLECLRVMRELRGRVEGEVRKERRKVQRKGQRRARGIIGERFLLCFLGGVGKGGRRGWWVWFRRWIICADVVLNVDCGCCC